MKVCSRDRGSGSASGSRSDIYYCSAIVAVVLGYSVYAFIILMLFVCYSKVINLLKKNDDSIICL